MADAGSEPWSRSSANRSELRAGRFNRRQTPYQESRSRMLLLGSHLSVAGGLHLAVEAADELGIQALQVFTANQRQWQPKPPTEESIEAFKNALARSGVKFVVSHASYLINLATADPANRGKSIEAMRAEIDRCDALGIKHCVVHPGAHLGAGEEEAIARIADALDEIYEAIPKSKVRTLLETTAGQGTCIGHRFEHLGDIIKAANCKKHLGVCLDTCHMHAAGYDLCTEGGYEKTMRSLVRCVGKTRIRCIHLNDSKTPFASRKDRHEHIGQGTIGDDAFRFIINDPRFEGLPSILETEKGENEKAANLDKINLARLRKLAN